MRYNTLGKTDLKMSAIGLGTWGMGGGWFGSSDDSKAMDAIHASLDHGITLIDTAPAYGNGRSEELVGRALKGKRDQVVIATKCGLVWQTPEQQDLDKCLTKESIIYECEQSLQRLQTDYIDLYQMHWPDVHTPIEESMEALMKLRQQGKIRYIGCSNFDVALMEEAQKYGVLQSLQPQYSLLERDVEKELLPYCREKGMGVLSYGSLGAGALTGKFKEPPAVSGTERRAAFYSFFQEPQWSKVQQLLAVLQEVAHEYEKPVAQVSINWVSQQPGMSCALVGAKNADQAVMNAAAGDWDLKQADIDRITQACNDIFA